MSIITCLKELNERKCLEHKDVVIFNVKEQRIKYKVNGFFLNNLNSQKFYNDEIFTVLKVNKGELSEKAYEYDELIKFKDEEGYWPESKDYDFPALTRLVKELYKIIEDRKPKYTKYNRFEIMDI